MKKPILLFTFLLWLLLIPFVFAECETVCPPHPSHPCMKSQPMHCDSEAEMGMMMFCTMMKSHEEMKTVLKSILVLQQRSLNASVKEKRKIKAEIDDLIKKLDAMPNMVDCPMMHTQLEGCHDEDVKSPEKSKEQAKPSEHRH